jgi:hypothetical protein
LSILEEADSEVLLMRLAEGASHLAQLPPWRASTSASATKDRNEPGV